MPGRRQRTQCNASATAARETKGGAKLDKTNELRGPNGRTRVGKHGRQHRKPRIAPRFVDGLSGILFVAMAVAATGAGAQRQVAEESRIFKAVADGVFTIFGDRGHGSGFLVDRKLGLVLTSSHVVSGTKNVGVQLDDSIKVQGLVVIDESAQDIAVVVVPPRWVAERPELPLATRPTTQLALEGERVVAIGSPLSQVRIVTSGIVSKVAAGAIMSDVTVNPGNSGGPLLDMGGEVVAINTFRDIAGPGAGVAGSIPITKAIPILEEAKRLVLTIPSPSEALLPAPPRTVYPLWGLEWAAQRSYNDDNYRLSEAIKSSSKLNSNAWLPVVSKFDYWITTPSRQHYQQQLLQNKRRQREEDAGIPGRDPAQSQLKEWREYVGDFAPLVIITITPKIGETGGSAFMNAMFNTGIRKVEYKSDLQSCELTRGDSLVPAVFRVLGMVPISGQFGRVHMDDIAQEGVLAYLPDVFYDKAENLVLQVQDLKRPDRLVLVPIRTRIAEQIWVDFEPYRDSQRARGAELLLPREES